MAKRTDRAGNSRLLSLPDELLQMILGLADHPFDRCSVALSCSRLRRLSRRTLHTLSFDFYSRRRVTNLRQWLNAFDDYSRVFTHLTDLTVELNSRYARSHLSYTRQPALPPVHLLPSLQSLSLLYVPSDYLSIPRCSSLTSLTLWAPESSTLSSLAFSSSPLLSSPSSPLSSSSSSPLASSPPSPLRTSLSSLTIHSAKLQGSLASLAFFPSLSSLSLHSCTVDPYELRSLSRSLHSLANLSIHSCPLVSSHSITPILQANPALSSLSLHGTTYRLFGAQSFRSLLSHSSQLHSLHLAGLPSFRPGLLAACSALRSLSLEGVVGSSNSLLPGAVSLDSLVVLLVQAERRGGGAGWEAGGHGGADGRERGRTSTPAAAAPVLPRGGNKQWGKYVDIRREGEAAQADKLAAVRDVIDFLAIAEETHDAAFAEANQMVRAVGESAMARIAASLGNIRFGISVCRSFSASVRESNAAMEWEEKLLRSFDAATASSSSAAAAAPAAPAANSNVAAAAAGPVAWFFSTELDSGEEVRDGEEEEVVEIMDGTLADESFPESVLSGLRSGAVDTREAAMNRLQEMVRKLMDALHAVYASFRLMRPLISYPRDASGGSGADGGAAAAAAAADGRAAVNRVVGGGGAEASQQAGNALEGRGPAEVAAGDVAAGEVAAGEVAAGEVAAGEVAAGEVAAGEAAAGEAAVGEVASGEVAPGDENISSSKPAIPVQVLCPPLESLTLQSLLFSSTPHVLWLPCNLPCTSPRMYLSPPPPPPPSYSCLPSLCSSLSSSCAPVLSTRPMSFQSIARAAVFGQLKRLHVVRCLGLEEQDWLQLLAACAKLEQLRVEQDDTFSDAVVARSRLQTLASLTVVMCEKITAASIGGVLGSFPRLRYLLVEEEKILARARRELLRAGVIVRGV
ncbi:unnamed protein product [Closterium sp. NIES-53]